MKPRFYEFFAGAGLANLGLGEPWECIWANDISPQKAAVYRANFGSGHFVERDLATVDASELPAPASLAWASFPCQDLSLAGWRKGIDAQRSGVFWAFWRIMHDLALRRSKPPVIAVENVVGLLYGDSFTGLCEAFAALDMQFGALVVDARHFVPQSRPRVFLVAVDAGVDVSALTRSQPELQWTPKPLADAYRWLPGHLRDLWRWWKVPVPPFPHRRAGELVEDEPTGVAWHTPEQTQALLQMMNTANRDRVAEAIRTGNRQVGFLYKRIRNGVQRAEVRFDGLSGCLRTPQGGSSRQTVLVTENGRVRSRLLSPRETARLMGAPDSFQLPQRYNDAYKAMGDGVAVPVVAWLSEHLLQPAAEMAVRAESAPIEQLPELDSYRAAIERRAAEWLARQDRPGGASRSGVLT